jgi:hypothetical protein
MANTIDWGEASVNNTNGYGKGATNNTIRWAKIYESSASGETNITGASGFSNTLSTRFDGVDDFASLSSTTNLRPTDAEINADGFSLSVWVNWISASGGVWANGGAQESGSYTGFSFIVVSDGQIIIRKGDGGGTGSSNRSDAIAAAGSISAGSWTHLAFVLPSANKSTWKIYVNGVSQTLTTSGTGGAVSYSGTAAIGSRATNSFNGAIDECAVFNTELSASDVTTIYNSGVPNDLTGTSGLVSWWRMGDGDTFPTISDNVGSNNGTMTNMSSGNFISNVPTFNSRSISLDGVDDFVTMGDVLDFERTSAFSISAWVKRGGTGVNDTVVSKMESSGNFRGYLLFISSTNLVKFVLRNVNTSSNRLFVDSTSTITDTNWHHILMTYDGSSSVSGVKIYIDGVSDTVTTAGTLSATTLNSSPFNIGARNSNSLFATATIDEVSVFNSELSASDITSIYNGGAPNDISSLSPVSWWRCGDGDNSPTLIDRGSGSNNGTMTNFTTFSTDVPT